MFYVIRLNRYSVLSPTIMTVAQSIQYLLQTCSKMPIPLINCTVNDSLVSATPSDTTGALHFIDVIQVD